jgi:hypothetical protein
VSVSHVENAEILRDKRKQGRMLALNGFVELVLTTDQRLADSPLGESEDRAMTAYLIVERL